MYLLTLCPLEVHVALTLAAAGRCPQLAEHVGLRRPRQRHTAVCVTYCSCQQKHSSADCVKRNGQHSLYFGYNFAIGVNFDNRDTLLHIITRCGNVAEIYFFKDKNFWIMENTIHYFVAMSTIRKYI